MRWTPIAVAVAVLVGLAALTMPGAPAAAPRLAFSLLLGVLFGIVLQRGRFCFFCNVRDLVERREAGGVLSLLVALAVGAAGYAAIYGAWLPVPLADRLPPDAHIGPVSVALAFAAFVFGVGMTVSGSCISAHLYRLGEGSPTAPFALLGALAGFALGFRTWNTLYLAVISEGVVAWLPHTLGYAGTLALTLAVLGGLAALALGMARPGRGGFVQAASRAHLVFAQRWPPVLTGVFVGVLGAVAYFRVAPLGVTAELGSTARTAAAAAGIMPETLYGLDGFRGCATVVKQALFSLNGVFVLGLVGGSFAAALAAGQFRPAWPTATQIGRGLLGGLLMGWAAMTALGCTVGVLLSGIHAGALAGWVFLLFCCAGVVASLAMQRAAASGAMARRRPRL